jgi:hypothetical protein
MKGVHLIRDPTGNTQSFISIQDSIAISSTETVPVPVPGHLNPCLTAREKAQQNANTPAVLCIEIRPEASQSFVSPSDIAYAETMPARQTLPSVDCCVSWVEQSAGRAG